MTAAATSDEVALLGLGAMGTALGGVLLSAGVKLRVWNRSPRAVDALAAAGARPCASPAEAAAGSGTVITMLADDRALDAVMTGPDGALAAMARGALHVSMSTISADAARRWEALHAARALQFVAAPVFGRPRAAADGRLFIVAAGSPPAMERAAGLLALLGQRTFPVGARPEQACAVKLAGNFMIMAATEALGEAMAVAEQAGVPAATVQEVIAGTIFDAPVYHAYGAMLVEERFRPAGFSAELGLKDMRLFDELADSERVSTPLLGLVRDRLRTVIKRHGADADWAAVGQIPREDARERCARRGPGSGRRVDDSQRNAGKQE